MEAASGLASSSSSSRALWEDAVREREQASPTSPAQSALMASAAVTELMMGLARLDSDYASELAAFATGLLAAYQVRSISQ